MKIGPAIFLGIALNGALHGLAYLTEKEMGPTLLLSSILLIALIVRWFKQDNQKYGHKNILDRGMFLITAGHIVIPLYLIWTRRGRGILLLLLALMSFSFPVIILALIKEIANKF
jgi:hypothetical protein